MPNMDGITATRMITERHPEVNVSVCSSTNLTSVRRWVEHQSKITKGAFRLVQKSLCYLAEPHDLW